MKQLNSLSRLNPVCYSISKKIKMGTSSDGEDEAFMFPRREFEATRVLVLLLQREHSSDNRLHVQIVYAQSKKTKYNKLYNKRNALAERE